MKRSHGPQFLSRKECSVTLTAIAYERISQVCESLHCSRSRAIDALIRCGNCADAKEIIEDDKKIVDVWRALK